MVAVCKYVQIVHHCHIILYSFPNLSCLPFLSLFQEEIFSMFWDKINSRLRNKEKYPVLNEILSIQAPTAINQVS